MTNAFRNGNHAGVIKSVLKSGQMLRLFTSRASNWGVSEMSRELGFSKTVTYNMAESLALTGLLDFDPATRTYRVGLLAFQLGLVFGSTYSFRDAAASITERLAAETSTTVILAVPEGASDTLLCIGSAEASDALFRLIAVEGQRTSLHLSAAGRAYLSALDEPVRESLIPNTWDTDMPAGTISRTALLEQLREHAANGWAVQDGEIVVGVTSLAVPLMNAGVCVAALSISYLSVSAQDIDRTRYLDLMNTAAAELVSVCGPDLVTLSQPALPIPR
jgi:DNA-binding IclR family transcriptional regulator